RSSNQLLQKFYPISQKLTASCHHITLVVVPAGVRKMRCSSYLNIFIKLGKKIRYSLQFTWMWQVLSTTYIINGLSTTFGSEQYLQSLPGGSKASFITEALNFTSMAPNPL